MAWRFAVSIRCANSSELSETTCDIMADRSFHLTSPSFYQGKFSTPKANRNSYHNSNKQRLFGESKSHWPSPANSFFLLNEFDPVQTIRKALAVMSMETHRIFCTANQTHNIITQYLHGDGSFLRSKLNFSYVIFNRDIPLCF